VAPPHCLKCDVAVRARATAILDHFKVFDARLWLESRRITPTRLPMLTYHSIQRVGPEYPYDAGVVDATPGLFDRQMAYIARYFTSITTEELRAAHAGAPLPGNPIVITFDDGYRNNLDVAVPILKRHGLRATFFIATAFITQRRLFWWDRIAYVIKTSSRERLTLRYPDEIDLDLRARRTAAIQRLLKIVKETHALDIERFLDELTIAAGIPWDRAAEKAMADALLLTWDDVRALRATGMDVQSHTSTHRVLNGLASDDARHELVDSRLTLERELGVPVRAVSYPCGHSIEGEQRLCADVLTAGYELGFACAGQISTVSDGRARPLHLRRLCTAYDMPMSWFRGMLALPGLTYL
jgi:peptidoglycan/xylan/chitin deacetylase (PgdA/CDA1 family)